VSQGALDETGMHTGLESMGGVGMSEGRDGHACLGDGGPVCGLAEGALDTGATPGRGSRSAVFVSAPRGGKEPGLVTGGFPGGAAPRASICGEGDVPVVGALAAGDRDLETLAIDVGDLQGEGCMEPESSTRDRSAGDLVV